MGETLQIEQADLADSGVRELIALHQRAMVEGSPPGQSFALDLSGLSSPDVTLWAGHFDGRVATIGALKRVDEERGEIKSMRTHPDYLRRGFAAAMLETIIDAARGRGFRVLSLETGSGSTFEPALALYRKRGFSNGTAFGDYALSEFNQCLHLALD